MKIDPPASLKHDVIDPTRSRKLLLHKKEIKKLSEVIEQKSLTCVLTSLYWKENHIKCDISMIGRSSPNNFSTLYLCALSISIMAYGAYMPKEQKIIPTSFTDTLMLI